MIDVDALPEPRPHHYVFAHRWIPRFIQTNPERFFTMFSSKDGQNAIASLWEAVGESLEPHHRMPSEGLRVHWASLHPGRGALIIEMPRPTAVPEAYFIAAVSMGSKDGEEQTSIYCLEYSVDFDTGAPATVIGTWKEEEHSNLGSGPEPTVEAWTAWLKHIATPLLN